MELVDVHNPSGWALTVSDRASQSHKMTKTQIVSIGEVMIELAPAENGRFVLSYGGDTFNTAVYLARAGIEVSYATALGDDPYSSKILNFLTREGIGTELVVQARGRRPGLYLIELDDGGEARFSHWRDTSPARDYFELPKWEQLIEGLLAAKIIFFSGVTLSIYSETGVARLLKLLELARESGVKVAFDSNFRARGWRDEVLHARSVYSRALKYVDIALPSFDDECALWGDHNPQATADRLQGFGIQEIVVKNSENDALAVLGEKREWIPVPERIHPIDSTAAGDCFNAGYLAARLQGKKASAAAALAHRLAGEKIRHRGAIMPRT